MNLNSAVVSQDEKGDIDLSMEAYIDQVQPIPLDSDRRTQHNDSLIANKLTKY